MITSDFVDDDSGDNDDDDGDGIHQGEAAGNEQWH